MKILFRQLLEGFGSLRLTIALLSLSMLLIFGATLDQVHIGVWGVQQKYFHSVFVFAKVPGTTIELPIFPGGYLLGIVLLSNLIAAHVCRFHFRLAKAGIWLTHLGLIALLLGEGASGVLQRDGQMRLDVGATREYTESFRTTELAVIDASDSRFDEVIAIPESRLKRRESIQHPRLPFVVRPIAYFPNAPLRMSGQVPNAPPSMATVGAGTQVIVQPAPASAKDGDSNWPAAYVELTGPDGSLGIWLVSTMLAEPQTFSYSGRTWRLALRPQRDYLPFTLTLRRFTHDIYPGTDIPKNFASLVRLHSEDGRSDRDVRIYMNHPLRYGGVAVYQAGFDNNDRTSVFQIVRNPGWQLPYLSCGLIAVGLALQFLLHLGAFLRQKKTLHQSVRRHPETVPARSGESA